MIQVCDSLVDPNTRKREIAALNQAMIETETSKGYIITRYETEDLTVEGGKISVLPIWRFLLEQLH